jgi:hypothetical protein
MKGSSANQLTDKGKGLKQKHVQIKRALKIFIHPTNPTSIAPGILGIQVRRKHTSHNNGIAKVINTRYFYDSKK